MHMHQPVLIPLSLTTISASHLPISSSHLSSPSPPPSMPYVTTKGNGGTGWAFMECGQQRFREFLLLCHGTCSEWEGIASAPQHHTHHS